MSSEDDPVCNVKCIPYKEFAGRNDSIILGVTKGGGHLGYLSGLRMTQWFNEPLFAFLNAVKGEAHMKNI